MRSGLRLLVGALLVGACIHGAGFPYKDLWKGLKGTVQQPTGWRDIAFDDAEWFEGGAPVGYGYAGIATLLGDMRGSYSAVFFRKTFTIDDTFPVQHMSFTIDWDDGFVAYLNGEYIMHRNMPTFSNPPYVVLATPAHAAGTPESVDLDAFIPKLKVGANVVSVQVHNASKTDAGFFFDAKLDVTLRAEPFQCVTGPTCADKGDGFVAIGWARLQGTTLESIQIRENGTVVATVAGDASSAILEGVTPGDHTYRVFGMNGQEECYGGVCDVTLGAVKQFRRGDVNDDGALNIVDPVFLARYLFQLGDEPGCFDTADVDDNGSLDLADVITLLAYEFANGAPPPAPGPTTCGADTELDALPICEYTNCP